MSRIADPLTLRAAWRRVRANKGGPGRDGVTLADFERRAEAELADLSIRLQTGRYTPRKLRTAFIDKPSGGRRRLAIPCVSDRIVQTAALLVLAPDIDTRFCASSYGYRPGRGVDQAIADLTRSIDGGCAFVVDVDLEAYFDSICHRLLMAELAIWIEEEGVLALFRAWLKVFSRFRRGVAQGSPISPLLSNLFLHPIDRLLSLEGYRPIRYADDLVIPCASERQAREALAALRRLLAARRLRLNDAKSRLLAPGDLLTFLGRSIQLPAMGEQG